MNVCATKMFTNVTLSACLPAGRVVEGRGNSTELLILCFLERINAFCISFLLEQKRNKKFKAP